jgi:hypothetical protein
MSDVGHPVQSPNIEAAHESGGLSGEEVNRLWAHGMHEDTMFIQRGSFFLVAQSLLLVAYSSVFTVGLHLSHHDLIPSRIVAAFGLAVTMIWILTSYLHLSYVRHIRGRLAAHLPEYRETRESWRRSQRPWSRRLDIGLLLAYGVPGLAGVLWVMLLLLV